jgi:hypothetical protein
MPRLASQLAERDRLCLLVIGPARIGKTSLISTCPGPVYVICSDDEKKLSSAAQIDPNFAYDVVNNTDGKKLLSEWEAAYLEASSGVKQNRYQTVVWDTISLFASTLIEAELAATDQGNGPNGRVAYDVFARRLLSLTGRLINLPCHLVVLSHDAKVSAEISGQIKKSGDGILPAIVGRSRDALPSLFHDVVYMAKKRGSEERVFHTSISGVFGPGCNNLPGVETIPADVGKMWERIVKGRKGGQGVSKGPAPPIRALAPALVKSR